MRAEAQAFLEAAGWGDAERRHLAGDASARSYERVTLHGHRAVLMDAPPGCGDEVADFLRIAEHLASLGLSPPRVIAADAATGFALLEDLGDAVISRIVEEDASRERELYTAAAEVLLHLQAAVPPAGLPNLSAAEWANSALFAADFYARAITGIAPDATGMRDALERALTRLAEGARVLLLRDYHAGNLLWLPERAGAARVGLLDFQLAQLGQPEYDLVSLLQDARRDVAPETEAHVLDHFARGRDQGREEILPAYSALGALRALRILGVFARLCLVAGKDGYLAHLPRVWGQLLRNLDHPELAELRRECLAILPAPDASAIEEIRAKCGSETPR